ncbi:MAG: aminotransferase class V-fold PLP-dependent enzyme [Gammaproteobacteria bacterium]|nr:MAG: aminotransferase class V-fold PLP-dependent enzyme [Gammaproteobacteria bacterium]
MDLENEFPVLEELIYLNHAAVAPWPRRTAEAVARFAEENLLRGALRYEAWLEVEQALREQARRLLGAAAAEDVALLKNTSEGLSLVAQGLDWRPGDRVVLPAEEFPSNRIPWEALRPQGVEVVEVPLAGSEDPEARLAEALEGAGQPIGGPPAAAARRGAGTRLLAVSWVQYRDGLRLDLARLGRLCRERGALLCVDAIQGLGALPLDVEAAGVDFAVADGHKWLLGPEGLALFWCRPELREALRLREHGWHMVEHAGDFERRDWRPAASARRFECGSPNMLGIHALHASLSLLLEVGIAEVAARVEARVGQLREALATLPGVRLLTPAQPERRAGILSLELPGVELGRLAAWLREEGVVCAVRGGALRLSPHFYTPAEQLDRAVELLACWLEREEG